MAIPLSRPMRGERCQHNRLKLPQIIGATLNISSLDLLQRLQWVDQLLNLILGLHADAACNSGSLIEPALDDADRGKLEVRIPTSQHANPLNECQKKIREPLIATESEQQAAEAPSRHDSLPDLISCHAVAPNAVPLPDLVDINFGSNSSDPLPDLINVRCGKDRANPADYQPHSSALSSITREVSSTNQSFKICSSQNVTNHQRHELPNAHGERDGDTWREAAALSTREDMLAWRRTGQDLLRIAESFAHTPSRRLAR